MIGRRKLLAAAFPRSPERAWREVQTAIEAATFLVREPDSDGDRIFVVSPGFRGSFLWSTGEARMRIRRVFPDLDDEGVERAIRLLFGRVKAHMAPIEQDRRRRNSWVHGWKEDSQHLFRWER